MDKEPAWEKEVNEELKVVTAEPPESRALRRGLAAPSTFSIRSLTRWPPSQEWNSALDGEEWRVLEAAPTVNICNNVLQEPEHKLIFNLTIWHTRGQALLLVNAEDAIIVLAVKPQRQRTAEHDGAGAEGVWTRKTLQCLTFAPDWRELKVK